METMVSRENAIRMSYLIRGFCQWLFAFWSYAACPDATGRHMLAFIRGTFPCRQHDQYWMGILDRGEHLSSAGGHGRGATCLTSRKLKFDRYLANFDFIRNEILPATFLEEKTFLNAATGHHPVKLARRYPPFCTKYTVTWQRRTFAFPGARSISATLTRAVDTIGSCILACWSTWLL